MSDDQHAQPEDTHEFLRKLLKYLQIINEELVEYINSLSWNRPAFYDDDYDEYSIQVSEKSPIAIAPVLPTEDHNNSLSMGDEHLDIISETESNKVINSSVEGLVSIPRESEGILANICDVPFSDKNHFDSQSDLIESLLTQDTSIIYSPKIDSFLEEFAGELAHIDPIPPEIDETDSDPKDDIHFIEQLLYDDTLSEDDSFKDIYYVEALPLDSELFSLKESPSLSFLCYSDNSLPEFKTFIDHMEETSSDSTTTHVDNSLPEYDSFLFEIDPDHAMMTDNRTMAEMLHAPTEGCAEAIVVPSILAEQFELKHSLINMMTSEQFFGLEKDNPHDHVR
nr:reverse transcriptase domain-containing protein [Tanacetum cinerariifolium]